MGEGKQAFRQLLEGILETGQKLKHDADVDRLADQLWPDFVAAVAAARAELDAEFADGFRRWQEVRHPPAT